ncbi:MAG: hypothetical protein Q7T73_14895 [Beijerinckiaceae bacterium]|nr:hypothetical protein [Beijerinckiaceae bacterium]
MPHAFDSPHVIVRPPLPPGEAPQLTVTDDGLFGRLGPFVVRQKPAGDLEITVDNEPKRPTLLGIAPAGTSPDALRDRLSLLERSQLVNVATARTLAAKPRGPSLARLGPVCLRPTVDLDGKLWADVWVDRGRTRREHVVACISVDAEPSSAEALKILKPWAARIAAEDEKRRNSTPIRAMPKPFVVLEK